MLTGNVNILHAKGVKTDSHLNNSNCYHVFENRSFYIMHAMSKEIAPYKTGCFLYEIITIQKFMSLKELTLIIKWFFQSLDADKRNTQRS